MIVEGILNLLKTLVLFVLNLFPDLPDTSFVNGFFDPVVKVINNANVWIHVPTVSTCFVLILLCYNARAIWSVVMWVIRKIPGVS
ncbi:hypothetical protein ACS3UN_07980 [Oscillospiraceae bacterium LTW-04]|nr:hypothetical protein RBH76_02365 [Oscillospiraceae bacterium MB24-C1]